MATLSNYLRGESVAVVQNDTTSLTLSSISIIPSTGTDRLLVSGDVVIIVCADTGFPIQITLNSDVTYTGAKLNFASTTVKQLIPAGSIVILDKDYKYRSLFRDYTIVTHKLYETGNTHANSNVIDPQYPSNITVNTGTTWSDGDTLANSYINNSIFRSPHEGFKLERITWDVNTDSRGGHNCEFSLYAKPITENGNTATDIELIDTFAITSQNDSNYVFNRDIVQTGSYDDNICLIPAFRKTGSTSSSDNFYATLTLLISTDPRQ